MRIGSTIDGRRTAGRAVLLVLAACLLLPAPGRAADEAAAVAVVAGLQAALVEMAAHEPPLDLAARVDRLDPIVREAHDLARMGRLTVRRYWSDFSAAERDAFLAAFTRLSVTTYASRFAGVGPDSFEILGSETIGEDRIEVHSRIRREAGEDVSLDYTLSYDGESWRIINVLADGASELSLMASEYYDRLQDGGFDELIAALEEKIAAL